MWRAVARDRRGSVALLMALTMPILLLAVVGAVQVVRWTVAHRTLQRTADLAALAGAVAYFDAMDPKEAASAAVDHVALNGLPGFATSAWDAGARSMTGDGITVRVGPGVRDTASVTIQVGLASALPSFLRLLSNAVDPTMHVLAWAEVRDRVQPCIVALAADGPGVVAEGSQPLTLSDCAVRSNAGISAAGTPIAASGFYARGAVQGEAMQGARHPDDGTITDPYAADPSMPQAFGHLQPNTGLAIHIGTGVEQTLQPGTYSSWQIDGDARLEPGLYQVNGDIGIGAAGRLQGQSVTIVSSGKIQMTAGATLSLIAGPPDAIAYASNTPSPVQIQGELTGTVYLPNADVQFTGGAHGGPAGCLRLIARSVTLHAGADSTMAAHCEGVGGRGFAAETGSVRSELVR